MRPELPGITPKSTPVPIKNEPPPSAKTPAQPSKPGSSYPAIKWSTVDVDAKPIHEASGKLITEIDMDAGMRRHS